MYLCAILYQYQYVTCTLAHVEASSFPSLEAIAHMEASSFSSLEASRISMLKDEVMKFSDALLKFPYCNSLLLIQPECLLKL